jgi:hypothetical protein
MKVLNHRGRKGHRAGWFSKDNRSRVWDSPKDYFGEATAPDFSGLQRIARPPAVGKAQIFIRITLN